ncbi:DUF6923 family protein, partial [Oceanithermus sp.]
SKTVSPSAGFNNNQGQTDVWAEQTYGAGGNWGGALCDDDADESTDPAALSSNGACFGGRNGGTSDDASALTTAEHVAKVTVDGAIVTGVDFGFSFNVVTNTNDQDDDTNNNRTAQGSLRQFVQNANAISGANAMRFVPAVAANASGSGGEWWSIELGLTADTDSEYALPAISDDATTIDGTAYSYADGRTVRDTNPGSVVAPGTVGVSGLTLDPYQKPELEVNVNDKGSGFTISASNTLVKRLATYNSTASYSATSILVNSGSGSEVRDCFVGPRADGSDPAGDDRARAGVSVQPGAGVDIRHNYVAHVYNTGVEFEGEGTVEKNFIEHLGMVRRCGDGISFEGGPLRDREDAVARYNYIRNVSAYGVESWGAPGAYTVLENTITQTGQGNEDGEYCGDNSDIGTVERGGIRIFGSGSLVSRNVVFEVPGHGVVVAAIDTDTPSLQNTITQNRIFDNGGIAIDLDQTHDRSQVNPNGDGVTPNDGQTSSDEQNDGIDYPVITKAIYTPGRLRVEGYIGDRTASQYPGGDYTIEVFKADNDPDNQNGPVELDSSGNPVGSEPHGEASAYLGSCEVSVDDDDGAFSCSIAVGDELQSGGSVTATATDASGNTSELGPNATVTVVAPFRCEPGFYQVIDKDLKVLDPTTGAYVTIGTSSDYYNSTGWDVRTNLIYGLGSSISSWDDHLVVVGSDGVAHDLGSPVRASDGTLLADIDPQLYAADMKDGYLYARWNEDLIKINVDTNTFETIDFTDNTGSNSRVDKVADIVYISSTNAFWGAEYGYLYKWDLDNLTVTRVEVSGLPASARYGAAYTDNQGDLYVSDNDGGVYRIDDYDTSSPTAEFLVNSEETSRNDGASCPLAPPPGFGIPVSGSLYHDLEPNGQRDAGDPGLTESELGTAALYAKLFADADGDCANGFDATAARVVEIDDTGAYRFEGVSAGNYCIVLDDSDADGDQTPYDPAGDGWLYTNPPNGVLTLVISDAQVGGGLESGGHDFGLFHGSLLTGTLFNDTGAGAADANDAVQGGTEPGIPDATV